MNKDLARDILKVIDTPFAVDTIVAYAENEIQQQYGILEGTNNLLDMAQAQGAIKALKNLKKIRDRALSVKEKEIGGPSKESNPEVSTWGRRSN